MTAQKPTLGLYIHIPFCRSKCLYCDFCSFPHRDEGTKGAYLSALRRDLIQISKTCTDYHVDTVYFGGGTPTLLHGEQLADLLETVATHYALTPNAEITAECNPVTESRPLFDTMRKAGFNRLSVGLQSIHDRELKALGRTHRYGDFLQTLSDADAVGFDNISADLMFGIPEQTADSFSKTLDAVAMQGLKHLSVYSLIIEEGTPFWRMKDRLSLPHEDAVADMYEAACATLEEKGFSQYEISNFARLGYRSRHNLKYWNYDPYLGFGLGAYSCFQGRRWGNSGDLSAYIEGKDITEESELLSAREEMNEYVMLRMRLNEGVEKQAFLDRFGISFDACFGTRFAPFQGSGLIQEDDTRLSFTTRGFALSNTVLAQVLDFSG